MLSFRLILFYMIFFNFVTKVFTYIDLDINNFNQIITSSSFTLVVFYTKYDKQSKKYSLLINELPQSYISLNQQVEITFCRLNVYDNISIQSQYNVKHFPMFFLFFGSPERFLEFDIKGLSSNNYKVKIIEWMKNQTKHFFEEISLEKSMQIKNNNITSVLFNGNYNTEEFRIYDFMTKRLSKLNIRFYFNFQNKAPELIIYREYEEIRFPNESLFNESNVYKFLSIQTKERICQVDQTLIEHTFKDKYPSLIFYYSINRDTIEKGSFYYNFLLKFQKQYEVYIKLNREN